MNGWRWVKATAASIERGLMLAGVCTLLALLAVVGKQLTEPVPRSVAKTPVKAPVCGCSCGQTTPR